MASERTPQPLGTRTRMGASSRQPDNAGKLAFHHHHPTINPFSAPNRTKIQFTRNPIITPWEKTIPHDTTAKIHWDIPDPPDQTNKGTQFGPTKHEGNDEPTDKPRNAANDQTGGQPRGPNEQSGTASGPNQLGNTTPAPN